MLNSYIFLIFKLERTYDRFIGPGQYAIVCSTIVNLRHYLKTDYGY